MTSSPSASCAAPPRGTCADQPQRQASRSECSILKALLVAVVALPAAGAAAEQAPPVPPGLEAPVPPTVRPAPGTADAVIPRLGGFWEARGGMRLREDAHERDASLAESRLQLEIEKHLPDLSLHATADFLYDALADRPAVDREPGDGFLDLREANGLFSPADFIDAKIGRQILTWGTGDLVFINDLFPKDWNSFLLGRDEEYLKAPSDALKLSAFTDWANLDVVYTPAFDSDRFIDGRRVSYFNSTLGRIAGRDAIVQAERPNRWFRDDEWAMRLYRTFGAYEAALYGYDGFWKSPAGSDRGTGRDRFPPLSVAGASLRGPLAGGIGNLEAGYYRSRGDLAGDDPFVRNSELRALVGYERELVKDLTLGLQYYLERMLDYGVYQATLPAGSPARDESRHVLTQRLTWLTLNQNVAWSLFIFISPSDGDAYLRPRVTYKVTDNLSVEAGGGLFIGKDDHTFFGQFEHNSNVYAGIRYAF